MSHLSQSDEPSGSRMYTRDEVLRIARAYAGRYVDDLAPLGHARWDAHTRELFDEVLGEFERGEPTDDV